MVCKSHKQSQRLNITTECLGDLHTVILLLVIKVSYWRVLINNSGAMLGTLFTLVPNRLCTPRYDRFSPSKDIRLPILSISTYRSIKV